MYDVRTKLAREILSELKRHFGDKLLPVVINFNSKLKEAASFGQPITEYDAASRGMQDFERLAAWLMENPPYPATAQQPETRNPALSRAAELVERARSLSARTAALAARLNDDQDVQRETARSRPQPPQPELEPEVPIVGDARESHAFAENARTSRLPEPEQDEPAPQASADDTRTDATAERIDSSRPALKEKLARLYGVKSTQRGLLFVQPAERGQTVAIAADFNGWDPRLTPMSHDESLGVWQACVQVPPGRYRYRLVIDGQWVADPYNHATEADDGGAVSNVVELQAQS